MFCKFQGALGRSQLIYSLGLFHFLEDNLETLENDHQDRKRNEKENGIKIPKKNGRNLEGQIFQNIIRGYKILEQLRFERFLL